MLKLPPTSKLLVFAGLLSLGRPAPADTLHIAVAANFRATLAGISSEFESRSGHSVILSSAATGVLYSQIIHGAPFQIFFAADQVAPQKLQEQSGSRAFCYAVGRLVLAGNNTGLIALADPRYSLAIANPLTAPYGRAAEEVLARSEFASGAPRKLIRGTNTLQTLQFLRSGAVDLALLPRALVRDAALIPESWHGAIEQHAIVLSPGRGRAVVDSYLNWLRSDTVRAQIIDAGYQPCP